MPWKQWAYLEKVSSADFQSYLQNQVVATFTTAAQRDSLYTNPPQGAMCITLDTGTLWQWTGTAWRLPWALPWGIVGVSAPITANVTLTTALADIAGASVGFTAVPNRLYRAFFGPSQVQIGTANNLVTFLIADGANAVKTQQSVGGGTITVTNFPWGPLRTPALGGLTGAQTLKARGQTGAANATLAASATQPVFVTVEDVGPNGAPT